MRTIADFFQFEAWLHADVPRVACAGRGKTTQMGVPWAREGSGFTQLFEALALALCRELPVRQAAAMLRCDDKQLWRRIEHYVDQARALDDMITVKMEQVLHVCQDMSAAYAKDVGMALPNAQINYDRFHVVAPAIEAVDKVRQAEMSDDPKAVAAALGTTDRKTVKGLMWGMRQNPDGWSVKQTNVMHWLQHSGLKSARARRLKMALREVYAHAAAGHDPLLAMKKLKAWLSWARRSRLEPFKKLALTLTLTRTLAERIDAVVRGMTDNRSNAFVEAMNGLLQQAERAARGFRTASAYIAIAFLRMSKLNHLPRHPFASAQAN